MYEEQVPVDEEQRQPPADDAHEPPRLIELGSYAELTRGHTGTVNDGFEANS